MFVKCCVPVPDYESPVPDYKSPVPDFKSSLPDADQTNILSLQYVKKGFLGNNPVFDLFNQKTN